MQIVLFWCNYDIYISQFTLFCRKWHFSREIRALAGTFGSAIRRLILLMMSGAHTDQDHRGDQTDLKSIPLLGAPVRPPADQQRAAFPHIRPGDKWENSNFTTFYMIFSFLRETRLLSLTMPIFGSVYQVDQSLQYQEERFMVYAFYGPVKDTNTGVTLCIQNQTKTQNLKAFIIILLLK